MTGITILFIADFEEKYFVDTSLESNFDYTTEDVNYGSDVFRY